MISLLSYTVNITLRERYVCVCVCVCVQEIICVCVHDSMCVFWKKRIKKYAVCLSGQLPFVFMSCFN